MPTYLNKNRLNDILFLERVEEDQYDKQYDCCALQQIMCVRNISEETRKNLYLRILAVVVQCNWNHGANDDFNYKRNGFCLAFIFARIYPCSHNRRWISRQNTFYLHPIFFAVIPNIFVIKQLHWYTINYLHIPLIDDVNYFIGCCAGWSNQQAAIEWKKKQKSEKMLKICNHQSGDCLGNLGCENSMRSLYQLILFRRICCWNIHDC